MQIVVTFQENQRERAEHFFLPASCWTLLFNPEDVGGNFLRNID
jgi:hypothetical protein